MRDCASAVWCTHHPGTQPNDRLRANPKSNSAMTRQRAGRPLLRLQPARHLLGSGAATSRILHRWRLCHAQARRFRKPPQLSAPCVSGGNPSPRKPTSSAGGVSSMATSNCQKSSAATICAPAAPDAGFKACCLKSGKYDGLNRDDYFQGIGDNRASSSHRHCRA